jgi:large subunit ribosomal protein L20
LPRARSGRTTHRRHKKVLELTKGHRAARHKLYIIANQSMLHALDYSYRHRRERKGDFRRLWIARINAAARAGGLTYSQLMARLQRSSIGINRKMLAEMAVKDPEGFAAVIASVTETNSPPV